MHRAARPGAAPPPRAEARDQLKGTIQMKKILVLAGVLFASTAFAGVSNSAHNMNNFGTVTTGDVCYYCHAAHNGGAAAPLWARSNPVITSYTYYTSQTISSNTPTLDGVTLACMSCHDGSIAVGTTIKGTVGNKGTTFVTGVNTKVGPDLSNDHPVGLVWNTAFAGLAASTAISTFKLYGAGTDTISCGSCHLVHDNTIAKFLRANPNSGAFCNTCHVNK